MERRLITIVAADLVGYSRLTSVDEEGTLKRFRSVRAAIIDPELKAPNARLIKTMGDGFLVEFSSPVTAVRAALAIQNAMIAHEADQPEAKKLKFRIGINLGDVIIDGDDILGDGVNVAARLESLAPAGGICISRAVHDQLRGKISHPMTSMGPQSVKNIPDPVYVWRVEIQEVLAANGPAKKTPERPSIAVLPFENMSGDPEQAYFSDGITDDIIIELARCRELFVIARHSSFVFRDSSTALAQVARDLGVQYILEGGVRRSGTRIRVTAQLIDSTKGGHLWAEKYDRNIEDIFEVQDEITSMIVNTLVGEIARDTYQRSLVKSSDKVNAYDHFLRASEFNYRAGRDDVRHARDEALKAISIDRDLARAHALVAWTYIAEFLNAWGSDPADVIQKSRLFALAAVDADGREPLGYAVLGWVYMCLKDFERGLAEQRRAMADNPGNAHYRSLYAFTLAYAGQSEKAIEELEKAMRLNPRHPDLYYAHYGRALFNLRRYEEAILPLEKIRTSQPGNGNAIALAAACYAALGRFGDAKSAVEEVRRTNPNYTLEYVRQFIPLARDEDLKHFIDNLALAGL